MLLSPNTVWSTPAFWQIIVFVSLLNAFAAYLSWVLSNGNPIEEVYWAKRTIGVSYLFIIALTIYVGITFGFFFAAVLTFLASFVGMIVIQAPFELALGVWTTNVSSQKREDEEVMRQAKLIKDKIALFVCLFALIIVSYMYFSP